MVRLSLLISTILLLFLPTDNRQVFGIGNYLIAGTKLYEEDLTAMEALELVKEQYAYDFIRTETGQAGEYYFLLPDTGLCLAYEGESMDGELYLIHLYEFVEDDPGSGYGHRYTYRWYSVHKITATIEDVTN